MSHNDIVEMSMRITKASYQKSEKSAMRWTAIDSDVDEDLYQESMSVELFKDFADRIENNVPVPEAFKSVICEESWCGGMPYLSIAHYKAGEGSRNVPGTVDAVYIDGNRLKSKGTLYESEVGRAVWNSLREDLYMKEKSEVEHLPVRISIGFLDLQHKHRPVQGGQEYTFTRSAVGQICPLCEQNIGGKIYMKGQLVHLALTRVPVNPRTEMVAEKSMGEEIQTKKDDAKSIIGESLVETLDMKSLADGTLVVRATEATTVGSDPVPDHNALCDECYDPNNDSYDQECVDRVLSANNVGLRNTFAPVKSKADKLLDAVENYVTRTKSQGKPPVTEENMATNDKVEKMQLGGENVPQKTFEYQANGVSISGDPQQNTIPNPVKSHQEDEVEDEKKEKEEKSVSALDKSFEQLKALVASGASVDDVNKAFAIVGAEVEKSYSPKPQSIDATNIAEIVKSAVSEAVAPLQMKIAQLEAGNAIAQKAIQGQAPLPRSLTIRPNELLQKSQSQQPVRQLSQIEKIARSTVGLPVE